ncbi:sugar transferase [Planococcus citreus]|uniref:sugar transferase n=1 Tax=Planococcus citreus TaxID=1373 RepID=UPI001F4FA085|nr:sugar transferase [Planococcus citreus]
MIKISSEGPVYFKQQRPGLHGEIFEVYKFRTMKPGSEKMITGKEVLLNDNRITTIGKYLRRFKVDELPQIFNVLKGEMSLVGPRPERLASLDAYTDEISKRLDIVPGMTGLAQVSGNIYITLQDRYKYDIYYAENFNIWLDVKIIFRTIGVILFGEDKYINNSLVNIKVAVKENNI